MVPGVAVPDKFKVIEVVEETVMELRLSPETPAVKVKSELVAEFLK